MSGFVKKEVVLQMLLETETELKSAEIKLTGAIIREKAEKGAVWKERLDLIERELNELSSCLNSTMMGMNRHGESA
ncbi:DUF5446 family protein [Bacillus sonorensis]|uniref:Uncharacterized protein n=2 Tax=Bacillus sonorensis TaxID=119858 RepID=M5PI60_9BACI|nr:MULTISPECIES: DUF5446 family protein [Bacillus]TWK82517.1 hypothetical protein CHCC20335_3560 [Bacillus paralicheniformis]ASB88749.1 hypothetical protein S101395_02241 [Bacillus sonorensis]EME76442.1 hypothetical protein BSONL12_01637 [Bacillus sonorensis L12]MBG9915447.1 hypothetical protein [Bacillus sonorensis]MCF7618103.1 YppD family protein [Bacillus sonorensis]